MFSNWNTKLHRWAYDFFMSKLIPALLMLVLKGVGLLDRCWNKCWNNPLNPLQYLYYGDSRHIHTCDYDWVLVLEQVLEQK